GVGRRRDDLERACRRVADVDAAAIRRYDDSTGVATNRDGCHRRVGRQVHDRHRAGVVVGHITDLQGGRSGDGDVADGLGRLDPEVVRDGHARYVTDLVAVGIRVSHRRQTTRSSGAVTEVPVVRGDGAIDVRT